MNKKVILLGGGYSVNEGIDKGLFEKIKDHNVWSLNYSYKCLNFLPSKQLWVDISFFNNNLKPLQDLYNKGVKMVAKKHTRYSFLPEIKQYFVTRKANEYYGKEAIEKNMIFVGRDGMVGMFALSLAIAEGYNDIVLLGFDFGPPNPNIYKTHYYQDKLQVISSGVGRPEVYWRNDGKLKDTIRDYEVYTRHTDIKIVNVSLQSNIHYFPKISYDDWLKNLEENKNE